MLKSYPERATGPGVTRQVLSETPELMVVTFRFNAVGAEGALHHHPHVQSTYCVAGRFRFTVDDTSFEVAPGDSFIVPSGVTHGCICLEPGQLIDTFTPRRNDFL